MTSMYTNNDKSSYYSNLVADNCQDPRKLWCCCYTFGKKPQNYRPVSGSFLSKLVERVVAKQLLYHINDHNLGNPHKSAYKQGHSTKMALLSIKNEVHMSLCRGEPTALILLDLSAAFDTINHSTLLDCLHRWFGVGGSVLKCFTSYLTARGSSCKNWFHSFRLL